MHGVSDIYRDVSQGLCLVCDTTLDVTRSLLHHCKRVTDQLPPVAIEKTFACTKSDNDHYLEAPYVR